jgi:ubiquinone/menaquinone biosynthesis C-methylase UbiE
MVDMKYKYIRGTQDLQDELDTMKKFSKSKLDIQIEFENFIKPYIVNKKLNILEVCCGIGYLANSLKNISPDSNFTCIDQTKEFIKYAKNNYERDGLKFIHKDMYDIDGEYDVAYVFNSLLSIPHYNKLMTLLSKIVKKHIFVFSTFYHGDIDFEIRIREYIMDSGKESYNKYYNVYSIPEFERCMYNLGAKNIEWKKFNINRIIQQKNKNRMGAYTLKLYDDKLIELTGIILKEYYSGRIDL